MHHRVEMVSDQAVPILTATPSDANRDGPCVYPKMRTNQRYFFVNIMRWK